jgi:hypothetical protein
MTRSSWSATAARSAGVGACPASSGLELVPREAFVAAGFRAVLPPAAAGVVLVAAAVAAAARDVLAALAQDRLRPLEGELVDERLMDAIETSDSRTRPHQDALTGETVLRITQWFLPLGRRYVKPVCS